MPLDYLGEKTIPEGRYLEREIKTSEKKKSDSLERLKLKVRLAELTPKKVPSIKKTGFKSTKQAYKNLLRKQKSERFKKLAKEQAKLGTQGVIRSIGSRAEKIEQQLVGINEVPFLNNLERTRARVLSLNNKWLRNVEKSVTDSFPD